MNRCTFIYPARELNETGTIVAAQQCPQPVLRDEYCQVHIEKEIRNEIWHPIDEDIADEEALERFWVCLGCDSVFEQADSALEPGQHRRWCSGIELEEGGRGD